MALKRIVVGVDGSDSSKAALFWAAGEAKCRGDYVLAVMALTPVVVAAGGAWPATAPVQVPDEADADAREALAAVVEEVLGHIPRVEVEQRVVRGSPAAALIDAARGAQLLVVGSRGHGGFAGLLLGSVSQQCVQHAPCPVVVVRAESLAA